MAEQPPSWKERAVSSWRQQGLGVKLRDLLEVDIEPNSVQVTTSGSSVVLDGIRFTMILPAGTLEMEAPCPRCHKPQKYSNIETLTDIGRGMDSLCRDCDFLVKSGLETSGAGAGAAKGAAAGAPAGAKGAAV